MYRISSRVIIILQFFLLLEFGLISENQAIMWFWSSPQTCLHFSSWCLHYLTGGWARLWNVKNCTPVSLGHNVLILPLADHTVHTIIIESICQCTECLGLLSVNWLWHSDASATFSESHFKSVKQRCTDFGMWFGWPFDKQISNYNIYNCWLILCQMYKNTSKYNFQMICRCAIYVLNIQAIWSNILQSRSIYIYIRFRYKFPIRLIANRNRVKMFTILLDTTIVRIIF